MCESYIYHVCRKIRDTPLGFVLPRDVFDFWGHAQSFFFFFFLVELASTVSTVIAEVVFDRVVHLR